MNYFRFLKLIIKMLNYSSVIFILAVTIYSGVWMKRDILSSSNIESKLILFAFSLAASTGLVGLIFDRFNETPPFQIIVITITEGIALFAMSVFIAFVYLNTR